MSNSTENTHIAVFPFPFGTHVLPLLNLVQKLAKAAPDCSFSFICTQKCSAVHFPKPDLPINIKTHNISDGVPEGHPLANHPIEKVNFFLKTGADNLHKGIKLAESEAKKRVTCIIADAFVTSSLLVAQTLNVPWIAFWPPVSCSLSLYFYVDMIRQHRANCDRNATMDFLPGLHMMRVVDMPQDLLFVGEEETTFSRELVSLGRVLPQAKAVVVNFFEELDPPLFVQDMRSKLKSLFYVVPPSFPILPITDSSGCLSWLDTKSSRSVPYVSCGTVVIPPPQELEAMAEALEESGLPFLWSLEEHILSLLPNGFVARTRTRGKIVSWVPQNQGVAARVIQDVWEIGVIIEGRVFTKNGLLKSLKLILVEEEGKKIRDNALKVKKTVEDAANPEGKTARDFNNLVKVIFTP
ncbi:hypothetical protein Fmac_005147 [Flemingia macrophylla]|uniref:Uncharacterized protein n=1 Tax=Flemingia macrophylla TaxID=520843 RepID=A0ABD1N7Z0_9FABA